MANWINHGFTLDGGSGASDRSDANAILIGKSLRKLFFFIIVTPLFIKFLDSSFII